MPIVIKLDVAKIDKNRIFVGKQNRQGHTPKYLDLVLIENRDGTDEYGNDGFISESVTKEERDRGVKGTILGNWKRVGVQREQPPQRPSAPKRQPPRDPDIDPSDDLDNIPF